MNISKLLQKYKWMFKRMFVNDMRSNMFYFALEGTILAIIVNLYNNNNNLFAQRIGATDNQLSYLVGIPQFVAMFLLLPSGIITDKIKRKRYMVAISIFMVGVMYLCSIFVPYIDSNRFWYFILFLSISMGFISIYNSSWQSYFSDVVPFGYRNTTLTLRQRGTLLMGMSVPFISGFALSLQKTNDGKIFVHQIIYFFIFVFACLQVATLFKIKEPTTMPLPNKDLKAIPVIKETVKSLATSKKFIFFMIPILIFHLSWHIDFTLFFIGKTEYLGLNEAMLSIDLVGCALVQLLTLKFWSHVNKRKGVRFSMSMAGISLSLSSINMLILTGMNPDIAKWIFLITNPLASFASATIALCLIQCLLQVIPDKNKSMSITIYSLFIVFSNAVMPIIGVRIYNGFGGDLTAFRETFLIVLSLRIFAFLLLFLRWYMLRNEKK